MNLTRKTPPDILIKLSCSHLFRPPPPNKCKKVHRILTVNLVLRVIDGDTIDVDHLNKKFTVRLVSAEIVIDNSIIWFEDDSEF